MKMSNTLFNLIKNEIESLKIKTDIKTLIKKCLDSGNSETIVAFDLFYMIQGHSKFRSQIDAEHLNDEHLKTALVKIMKGL